MAILLSLINWSQLKTVSLDEGLLVNPKNHYSRQWVLVPKSGDFKEVQKFVEETLK